MPSTPAKLPSNKRRTQPEECSVYPSFISKYLGTTFKPTPVAVTNLSQQKSDTSKPFTNIPIFLFCIIFIYLCVYLFIYLVSFHHRVHRLQNIRLNTIYLHMSFIFFWVREIENTTVMRNEGGSPNLSSFLQWWLICIISLFRSRRAWQEGRLFAVCLYFICFPTVSSNFLLLHTHDVFKEKKQIPLKNHMNYNGEQYKC